MTTLDFESLKAMTAQELAECLGNAPEDRVQIVHVAAEGGLAEAQLVYGQMLLDGTDVSADLVAAFGWFNRAAQQHNLMALNMVGRCYDLGWGTSIDKRRAAECYHVAAERGLPHAMYNYATLLALGDGIAEHKADALLWFRRAADGDDREIAAKASNYIGSFHEDGWVVAKDTAQAAHYYRIAAEGGDFRGQFNYARMLGEAANLDEALIWLGRVRDTATPAFLAKTHDWLLASPVAGFADRGAMALTGGEVAR